MKARLFSTAAAVLLSASFGAAQVLTFEGLQDNEAVHEFYNGGAGGLGSTGGTNFGVSFSPNSLALVDADAGGDGNFANEPSPSTVLYFVSGSGAIMNVAAGFNTDFSFFYSSTSIASVRVYAGLNGTGALLATLSLSPTPLGPGDPNPLDGLYSAWTSIGVSFAGTAHSVDFGGSANFVGFDNITLGTPNTGLPPVPEPSTYGLMGAAVLAGAILYRRRTRRS